MSRSQSSEPPASFEALIAQVAGGSESAVWELLSRYSKNILRVARRTLPTEIQGKVDPADIVQSVWISLLRHPSCLAEFQDAQRLVAYMAGMARLKVIEVHRHFTKMQAFDVRREVRLLSGPIDRANGDNDGRGSIADRSARTPSSVASVRERWSLAVEKEGIRGHEVVKLRLQGLTQDEVAEKLGVSKSTVRRILHSMLQSLSL